MTLTDAVNPEGVTQPVVSRAVGGGKDGNRQLSGPDALQSPNSWDHEGRGRQHTAASGTRLFDEQSLLRKGDEVCLHTESCSLCHYPKPPKNRQNAESKKKNWLAGTQLRDSCAQNRKDMMADSLLHLEKTMHNCYHKRAVSASILPVMFKNGCPTGIQQLAYLQQQACRD